MSRTVKKTGEIVGEYDFYVYDPKREAFWGSVGGIFGFAVSVGFAVLLVSTVLGS